MSGISSAVKLSSKNLGKLRTSIPVPKFNREGAKAGIVHFGVGGFHRSHQAVYTARTLAEDNTWGICGVGLVPNDRKMQESLASQDNLYTLLVKNSKTTGVEVIGSIFDYVFAGGDRANDGMKAAEAVIERLASDDTKIVSLTVTEKAYTLDDSTGDLDVSHPLIVHDLENPTSPKSPVGYVVAGLKARKEKGMEPYTVLSCDNLPMNGHLTSRAVTQYAEALDSELADWIKETTSFPSTMVDRITPATTDSDIALLKNDFKIDDAWPVCAEDYTQWVIEDNFTLGRPNWEKHGALMVKDVEPYELMKLRLLNGSHSALAYLSYLAGYEMVDKAMGDDMIYKFVKQYMETVTPSVPEVPGVDLNVYKSVLLERFGNPNVSDQVLRLAEDGSKKMVGFIRGPVTDLLKKGEDTKPIAAAVAGWIRFCSGVDEKGREIEIKDPKAVELKKSADRVRAGDGVAQFLEQFFDKSIAESRFCDEVSHYVDILEKEGAAKLLRKFN